MFPFCPAILSVNTRWHYSLKMYDVFSLGANSAAVEMVH